jgi:hypothetical protein
MITHTPKSVKIGISNELLLESMIDKPLDSAIEMAEFNGFSTRVTREDDVEFFVTMDLRFNRINFQNDNGKISKASIG